MRDVLDAVHEGFRLKGLGKTEMPPKIGIHTVPDAFIHAMPAHVEGVAAGLKWVSGYPGNVAHRLPYISGLLILNDPATGIPIAVMDCAWITAARTGASVGISARYLARRGSTSAAIVGCGVQARMSLWALVETLPELRDVSCYDLFPTATANFIQDMGKQFPRLRLSTCTSATDAAKSADVVVTAIPIVKHPSPPLDVGAMKEGALAVSLDYDSAWTSAAMRQCQLFVADDVGQLLYTKRLGDYFAGIPERVDADLGELCAELKPGRLDDRQRIFSMNMGIAVDDMMVARLVHDRATSSGAGTVLPL